MSVIYEHVIKLLNTNFTSTVRFV